MALAPQHPDLAAVRSDLGARVGALEIQLGSFPIAKILAELDAIRRRAAESGMRPAVSVIHALESALARGERGPMVAGWLQLLRDAVDCDRSDAESDAAFTAACRVRLNS